MTLRYSTDIVIFGGGIAGLWLLNSLREAGYQAILFERHTIGGGQTLASQGIIHGGLKYALQGSLNGAAQAIAAMPERWRQCLAGEGDMDLRGTQVLCEHYYMWSGASMRSSLWIKPGSCDLSLGLSSPLLAIFACSPRSSSSCSADMGPGASRLPNNTA